MAKRFLSLALVFVLTLTLLPGTASAASATEIVPPSYADIQNFSEGLAAVQQTRNSSTCGFIDAAGQEVIPCQYLGVKSFSEGLAAVYRSLEGWGFVDKTGKEVIPCQYSEVRSFSGGLAAVQSKGSAKWGFIDKTGREVVSDKYSRVEDFSEGFALVYSASDACYGFIDTTGQEVIPCQYSGGQSFQGGYALVKIDSSWNMIDKTGRALLPDGYQMQERSSGSPDLSPLSEGLLEVRQKGLVGFLDVASGSVVVPAQYELVRPFSEGLAAVMKTSANGGGWTFVDKTGKEVFGTLYADAQSFSCGYAKVTTREGQEGIIDQSGKFVSLGDKFMDTTSLSEGIAAVGEYIGGKRRYGFVDGTGKEIVPCKYAAVQDFSEGIAAVKDFEGKWGFVDKSGTEIMPCQYRTAEPVSNGFSVVANEGLQRGLVSFSGSGSPSTPAEPSAPAQTNSVTAAPTASTVLVNGEQVAFDAYNIGGNNYFKLRDLAYVLNGTEKQFEVSWDNSAKTIALTSGQSYTANGSEMAAKGSGNQTAALSTSKILVDGEEIALTAYNIGGNNYFKLRDLGQVFDFGIGWDNNTKTITIDTSTGYTE